LVGPSVFHNFSGVTEILTRALLMRLDG
jgi:hypothetical protein